jgi:hypothetical protein
MLAMGILLAALTLVVVAPGYPGSTAEAQAAMDALAGALAEAAGLPPRALAAVYHEDEQAGLERLKASDAALALVTLPFFLQYEKELGLSARLQAVQKGGAALESWTLVAKKGRVPDAEALGGFTLISLAGYSPTFVRAALLSWGAVPKSAQVEMSAGVLSALRRAASGEPVAVLLDAAQAKAVAQLPFAAELETVTASPAMPSAIVATVGKRAQWKKLHAGFDQLSKLPTGRAALDGVRMEQFVRLDRAALEAARAAFEKAQR